MTDTLHSELAAEPTGCKVCVYLGGLPAAEASEWARELALPVRMVGHLPVQRALNRRGVTVTEASVRRHRRNHG